MLVDETGHAVGMGHCFQLDRLFVEQGQRVLEFAGAFLHRFLQPQAVFADAEDHRIERVGEGFEFVMAVDVYEKIPVAEFDLGDTLDQGPEGFDDEYLHHERHR